MKRFWTTAEAQPADGGWSIFLDGRPVRTPARAVLRAETEPLARAIAAEWQNAPETVDPRAMPMTGLANAAVDRVAADPASFAAGLAKYGEGDLLTYRADGPEALVSRQAERWDPFLQWARRRFDVDFAGTHGITFVPQPAATIERLSHAVAAMPPFALAGLSPLVTIGGSLVVALAVAEQQASVEEAWAAVSLDEAWQIEKWGSDAEAEAMLEGRRAEFLAGARFLDLLR
ncbi:ATP12 family chaperone protein [Sphingomonas sp. GCM10030256]|uniref:ATP12 family chaperone protein n=1 Tax=Sphingomonas sp. GCM10030256 TaxID=3273427 RepID=UPI0036124B10